ncbi:MAG: hypothetical protein IT518_10740 [Burkholderiales bacterium]|nr:hypothetical protein [Burkholderiales bacterium]
MRAARLAGAVATLALCTQAWAVLPTVSITAPANNAKFVAPAAITIAANAADSDGTVTKVEFYRNGTLLGTDTTSPYSYAWSNVAVGTYALTAKAYDNAGGVTTSATVNIQVKANVAPTVAITAPANNAAYTAPATIAITANAADSDGTVAKVEFYQGATRLNTDSAAPYAFTWSNVAGGTYSLTAKATDDNGAVTTSTAITVKVNAPPTVALTAPANNTTVVAPVNVTISANASDAGGSVAKVQFFRDGTLLATDTTSPYSYAWSNVPIGTYVLTARATDNLGATTTSAPRTLTVVANQAPIVALTAPANGTTVVAGAPVVVTATASDADGTIANVKFYRAGTTLLGTDTSNPYSITTTLPVGTHTLTAVATDSKATLTTSAPVTVTAVENQLPAVTLTSPLDNQAFPATAPPDITLTATAVDADGRVVNVKFYYTPGPTTQDPEPARKLIGTVTAPPYRITWPSVPFTHESCYPSTCDEPEYYGVTAVATDDAGGTNEAWATITVPNRTPWAITIDTPSPYMNAVFNAPATVVIAASASTQAVGDAVARVEVIANGSVIATLPPASDNRYAAAWRNVGAGTHSVLVRLHDQAGFTAETEARTVIVRDAATPPVVTITSPPNEKRYLYQVPFDVAASATDDDGSVASVRIRPDDGYPGFSGTGASAAGTWSGARDGVHVISAEATDNAGAVGNARPVYVEVLLMRRLQAVVLTSPAPGATVTNPVVLEAEVGAPDGALAGVEFYRGGTTLLGTVTSPPYRLVVSVPAGAHSFTARGIVLSGPRVTSTPVSATVAGGNAPPNVALTQPSAGQSFAVGSAVALAATASDPDGSIAKVEFTVAGAVVATATAAPYTATWTAATAGTYSVNARAVDNQGGTRLGTAVDITIGNNTPPSVALTAPAAGQSYYAGVPFTLSATASDAGGAIAKVEFFAGSTLIGADTSAPYSITGMILAAGTFAITAKATDSSGAVTTSTPVNVTITANALPTVALTSPGGGQVVVAGGIVDLVAEASDSDGGIARVEFYAGPTLLATVTAAPYRFAWSNVPTGTHTLTARAVDSRGAIAVSAPVLLTAGGLALAITSPATNATVGVDFVDIVGTYGAPANSGITVNGVVAAMDGRGNFALADVPLAPGANTFQIKLTTQSGETLTQTRVVTSTADAPLRVYADPADGYAPKRVAIRYTSRVATAMTTYSITNIGGGVLDTAQLPPGTLAYITFEAPGVYQPRVTINYGGNLTYTQTVTVVVRDFAAMDQMFQAIFRDFIVALDSNNKPAAMQSLSPPMKDRFGPVFDTLAPSMSQILDTFKGFAGVAIGTEGASYAVTREINGRLRVYFVDFAPDESGVWRIDSM